MVVMKNIKKKLANVSKVKDSTPRRRRLSKEQMNDFFGMTIGQKVRFFRKGAGMTQSDVAQKIGITFQQLQKYESDKNSVSVEMLCMIADAIGIKVERFFVNDRKSFSPAIGEESDEFLAYLAKFASTARKIKSESIRNMILEFARVGESNCDDNTN